MHAAYSGQHLCETHFCNSVESRVRARIRDDNLLPASASLEQPQTWLIGLSGGKDSVVLTHILSETFAQDPRVELVALSIHEGIDGYRDESLDACRTLVDELDIEHEVLRYGEELDVEMDSVVENDPENMAACGYCGVFRRDLLASYAAREGADKLLTGHNLDDESETALMNFLSGDIKQMAKHYDASLGPFPTRDSGASESERTPRTLNEDFVPRAKPLRDVPEKEVALYAHLRDLPAHIAECPHSSASYRAEIQNLVLDLEDGHPGTRHSIMAGYEDLAALAATAHRDGTQTPASCTRCGSPTKREVCRKCTLLDAIHEAA